MKSIASIQALRCFAAWMVFLHHFVQYFLAAHLDAWAHASAERGILGVDIFFVVSGFIMFYVVTERPRFDAVEFGLARFFRIVPAYWFFTLVLILAKAMLPSGFTNTEWTDESLASSLLFVPAVNPATGTPVPPLIVGWSLNLEIAFYLTLCVCLAAGRTAGFALTAIFCFVLSALVPIPYGLMAEFALGMLLGLAWRSAPGAFAEIGRRPWIGIALSLLSIVILVGAPLQLRPVGAFLLVAAGLFLEPLAKKLHPRVLYLGDISYSTYLLHIIVLGLAFAAFKDAQTWLEGAAIFALTAGVTVAASHLSFRYIERGRAVRAAHEYLLRRSRASRLSRPGADAPAGYPNGPAEIHLLQAESGRRQSD